MKEENEDRPMGQVIETDEARIRDHLDEMVRGSVDYYHLKISGSVESEFPFPLVKAISHGENERMAWYKEKDKRHHLLVNKLYSDAEKILFSSFGHKGDLPISLRQKNPD